MSGNYPRIIGLSGVARAGKDTVGNILHGLYGYHLASFSDALNRALCALNPIVTMNTDASRVSTMEEMIRYADLIDSVGYEEAKGYPEVRRLLQAMGTEVGRNIFGEDIWVEAMFKTLPNALVAITNVRFPNEYQAVKDQGGEVWRVTRPGFEPANGHISDTALDGYTFDHEIVNDGSVYDLADTVVGLMDLVNRDHNRGTRASG